MQNIVYDNDTWDEKREDRKKLELHLNKFHPKTKDPRLELMSEVLRGLVAIEHNLLDISDRHFKFAVRYADMCNEENICKYGGNKLKPLEARFFFYNELYYMHWFLQDGQEQECAEVILDCIRKGYLEETRKRDKVLGEINQMTNIEFCTRFGEFEVAKRELEKYSDIKEVSLEPDIIYDFYGFYFMLLDYFINNDMQKKEKINEIFLHFFHEHEKGNRTLWRSQGAFFGIYNVYYIYYKHFLGLTDEEVTVYNVFRSAENGICFWKTKDNIEN